MIKAGYEDKQLVVDILTSSFNDNKSVNYIIKQDDKRIRRIQHLMGYSFEVCIMFGDVFLSDDNKACALIIKPDNKKTTLKSILLDIQLIFTSTGLINAKKAMDREARIKKLQPKRPMYYVWFIGVDPKEQNKGIGSRLLKDVLTQASLENRIVTLETSTIINIPWYEKFGFKIYDKLDLGYKLFFLKKE